MTRHFVRCGVLAGVLALVATFAACDKTPPAGWQGYVEGDYVLLTAQDTGVLAALHVQRGQTVAASAPAFELDRRREEAAVNEARARVRSAEARANNLVAPRRQRELDALNAQLSQAAAARALAAQERKRAEELQPQGALSKSDLDTARSRHEQALAREAELAASVDLARQGIGREAERAAALADVETARAALAQAEWQLAQRTVAAPLAARVQDTFFSAGETVPAGRAVASLLPDAHVKLRFFVPEPALGRLQMGGTVHVTCDGCTPLQARITRVSTQAEYTPPMLYNRESRAKLVFMVEAQPLATADAAKLHPGQPVDVTP